MSGLRAGVATQLGHPSGLAGRVVGRLLNRVNKSAVLAAVECAELHPGSAAAEIGFGGGIGLGLLLDRVGDTGAVHGVEISMTMLADARRRFRRQIESGTLHLYQAPMADLPLLDGALDAVVSTNTIYFVDDLSGSLAELARVLRPLGRLVLGVGDPAAMARMRFTEHGFKIRPVNHIIDHVRQAGFTLVDDRRVGDSKEAFHVLICEKTSP